MAIKKLNDTTTFHFFNANPKDRRTCDCVVRAISTATGIPWDEVLRGLTECAIKHSLMVNDNKLYEKYLADLGWKKMPAPRRADNTRYTGSEWCSHCKKNNLPNVQIAHIGGHHIVCIIDYKVWDIWNSTGGAIGNYWVRES